MKNLFLLVQCIVGLQLSRESSKAFWSLLPLKKIKDFCCVIVLIAIRSLNCKFYYQISAMQTVTPRLQAKQILNGDNQPSLFQLKQDHNTTNAPHPIKVMIQLMPCSCPKHLRFLFAQQLFYTGLCVIFFVSFMSC